RPYRLSRLGVRPCLCASITIACALPLAFPRTAYCQMIRRPDPPAAVDSLASPTNRCSGIGTSVAGAVVFSLGWIPTAVGAVSGFASLGDPAVLWAAVPVFGPEIYLGVRNR